MYLRVVCLVDWHLEVFYCPYYKIKIGSIYLYLRVVCLVDWHLEVFYCPYYKIKNARMHELNFMHPNIYYRTI